MRFACLVGADDVWESAMKPLPIRLAEALGLAVVTPRDRTAAVAGFVALEVSLVSVIAFTLFRMVGQPDVSDVILYTAVLTGLIAVPVNLQSLSAYMALERATEEIRRLSLTDMLTDLPNRRAVMNAMAAGLEAPAILAIIDIDRFKAINDTHGHPVGDAVIRHIGRVLGEILGAAGCFGRIGGEEFALFANGEDLDRVRMLAVDARRRIAAAPVLIPGGPSVRVSVSIGIAIEREGDQFRLYAGADRALYRAKSEGRNRVFATDSRTQTDITDADDLIWRDRHHAEG